MVANRSEGESIRLATVSLTSGSRKSSLANLSSRHNIVSLLQSESLKAFGPMSSWTAGPRWGVSGGATLNSQFSDSKINNFDRTIRPFEQTMRPSQQTKPRIRQSQDFSKELRVGRPSQQPLVKESRSSQRLPQQSRLSKTRRQPQERSRSSQQTQEHLVAPRRGLRLSQLATRPSEKQARASQRVSGNRLSLEVSLGLPGRKPAGGRQQQVELSPARRREIMSCMSESVKDVMTSMLPGDANNLQWKSKLRKKNIAYYVDKTSVKPGQTRFCCVSHTHATVDEIMSLFLPTDKDSVLRNNKMLHDNLIDAKVLSMLRRPTKERPMNSMYLRYTSFQTPGPLSNREMYVAVATDMIRQSDGSTIGYCLWDSIDDPEVLKASKNTGLELCTSFRSGFFFRHPGRRESTSGDPMQGQTKIVYMVGMESSSWAAGLTTRLLMEKHGSALERLCSYFRRKYLDPSTFVMKTQWETKSTAKSCKQCDKEFQVLSNRVNCHACGHVVCRSCVSKESVELHTVGLVSIHVCFWCLEKAGLPAPASAQKTRSSLRQRRLHSETASTFRQSISVVYADMAEDDDTDAGEWAITTLGIPVRPSRMAACV